MACFKKLNGDFYAIHRDSKKAQILILPVGVVVELYKLLELAMQDGLERMVDGNLPDSQHVLQNKYIIKVSSPTERCGVRVDVREWYTDKDGDLKPTRSGVNLGVEDLTVVNGQIHDYIEAKKNQLMLDATLTALHDATDSHRDTIGNTSASPTPTKKTPVKRKATQASTSAPATKKPTAKKGKKAPPKKKVTVVESDTEELSPSENEEEPSDDDM